MGTNIIKNKGEGGYVFISHSHYDIKQVRLIRNTLEENGFEPLCFYLKCLNDDDEVDGLIKREIDSRDIFLYVESENSKKSEWVNKERAYINTLSDKTVYKINIDSNNDLKEETLNILNKFRVFISYSRKDRLIFEKLKQKLIEKDLKVFDQSEPGVRFDDSISYQIKEACKYGCFVVLVTKESLLSSTVAMELQIASHSKDGLIIPIMVGECNLDDSYLEYNLVTHQFINIDNPESDSQFDIAVKSIQQALRSKKA